MLPSFWKEPYPWPMMRITLDGLSSIDLPSLAIHTQEEARSFLQGYGFDLERRRDRARALYIHGEAVALVDRRFLKDTNLTIPDEVAHPRDLTDLLLLASNDLPAGQRLQPWACAILRVMHTIGHCDDDLRLLYFRDIRGQILESYRAHVVNDGGKLSLGRGHDRVPLESFQVKERKDRDSVILKLLHKPGNVAEQIFDRIGVRLVTPTRLDALLALRYLRDHHVFSFANIQPEQSKNALIDLARFLASLDALEGDAIDEQARARLDAALQIPDGTLIQPEQDPRDRNPHTLEGYRAIQFTARQRIRVTPKGRLRLRAANMILNAARSKTEDMTHRIEALLAASAGPRADLEALLSDAREAARTLADAEHEADPLGIEEEISFFFPYEVHILDAESARRNEEGPASHAEYKKRQLDAARRRVLGRLL